jgi:hypothetical protein
MNWYTKGIFNIANNVVLRTLVVKYRVLGKSEINENCSFVSSFHFQFKNDANIRETPPQHEKLFWVGDRAEYTNNSVTSA